MFKSSISFVTYQSVVYFHYSVFLFSMLTAFKLFNAEWSFFFCSLLHTISQDALINNGTEYNISDVWCKNMIWGRLGDKYIVKKWVINHDALVYVKKSHVTMVWNKYSWIIGENEIIWRPDSGQEISKQRANLCSVYISDSDTMSKSFSSIRASLLVGRDKSS